MNHKSTDRKKPRGRVKATTERQGSAEDPRNDLLIAAIGAREAGRAVMPHGPEAFKVRASKLEQELAATKEYLQSMVETQEATNEELQSVNEELTTVNEELRNRNLEITRLNNDLTNLFASIDTAVVLIGSDLTIRRFTPTAEKFLGLLAADAGRPLLSVNPSADIPDFQSIVAQVIADSRPVERELKDARGDRFLLRILPYRTVEDKIEGAVITVVGSPQNADTNSAH